MTQAQLDSLLRLLLRLGAFFCFAGWTWQHYYWEAPYGVLLWQEGSFELAQELGADWQSFVGSGANDGWVQRLIALAVWPYLACTLVALTVKPKARLQMTVLVVGSGLLALLAYANYVRALREPPMLLEHGGQVLSPILLVLALACGVRHRITLTTAMLALVMVFAGHGAYAIGLWPTPSNFHGMTRVILGSDHETTTTLLRIAGAIDFAVCVGVLVPMTRRITAMYAAGWGLLTAVARPVAGMSSDLNYYAADQYLHEAVLRAPHFVIPLFLFFAWQRPKNHEPLAPT